MQPKHSDNDLRWSAKENTGLVQSRMGSDDPSGASHLVQEMQEPVVAGAGPGAAWCRAQDWCRLAAPRHLLRPLLSGGEAADGMGREPGCRAP